jgi:hypothetical protein
MIAQKILLYYRHISIIIIARRRLLRLSFDENFERRERRKAVEIRSNKYYDNCVVNFFVTLPSQFIKNNANGI